MCKIRTLYEPVSPQRVELEFSVKFKCTVIKCSVFIAN